MLCHISRSLRNSTIKNIELFARDKRIFRQLPRTVFRMNTDVDSGGSKNEDTNQTEVKTAKQLKNEAKKQAKMEKFAKKQQQKQDQQSAVMFSMFYSVQPVAKFFL